MGPLTREEGPRAPTPLAGERAPGGRVRSKETPRGASKASDSQATHIVVETLLSYQLHGDLLLSVEPDPGPHHRRSAVAQHAMQLVQLQELGLWSVVERGSVLPFPERGCVGGRVSPLIQRPARQGAHRGSWR